MIRTVGACRKLKKSMNCGRAWRRLPSKCWAIWCKFGRGGQDYRVVGRNRRLLEGNPYWSPELDARLGSFERERYVTLMPVALGKIAGLSGARALDAVRQQRAGTGARLLAEFLYRAQEGNSRQ